MGERIRQICLSEAGNLTCIWCFVVKIFDDFDSDESITVKTTLAVCAKYELVLEFNRTCFLKIDIHLLL